MRTYFFKGVLFLAGMAAAWAAEPKHETGRWEILEGCQLVTNPANDGDSFYVRHKGTTYIFRLYGVDAPETNMSYPDRNAAQALHFSIKPEETVRVGERAERFSRTQLSGGFKVETSWQDARGNSPLPRYYANIVTAQGENLAETLAKAGLVRVYGLDSDARARYFSKSHLLRFEREAKSQGRGAFAKQPPRSQADHPENTAATSPPFTPGEPIDLNTASEEQLLAVPGIGPHYAREIENARPFTEVEDLEKIQGIGRATLLRLQPYFKVSPPESPKAPLTGANVR